MYRIVCLAALLVPAAIYASDVRISEADERFRIKYGTYPPHIQKARDAAARQDPFSRFDRNRDGRISLKEWKKEGRCACLFADHDRDGDGHVTRSEWHAASKAEEVSSP